MNHAIAAPMQAELREPFFYDPILLTLTVALAGFGLLMVYSTTGIFAAERFGDPLALVRKQAIAAAVGLLIMGLVSRASLATLEKASVWLYPLALFLACLSLIPGVGIEAGGASRWIGVGPFRFQPSEFAKVFWVLFIAGYFSRHESRANTFLNGLLKPCLLLSPLALILLKQPDFGSTAVVTLVTITIGAACGARLKHLALVAGGLLMVAVALVISAPYRMARILAFLNPESDPSGKGYQLVQSLIAVGSGEIWGVGLGASQQKLYFLPAAHTDFVFAVICEELGFVGAVFILAAFCLLFWRGLRITQRFADNTFGFSLALGLTMLLSLPAFMTPGVVLGLLPTKGMVLPLVGYGGSSLMACLMAVGLLLALARAAQKQ